MATATRAPLAMAEGLQRLRLLDYADVDGNSGTGSDCRSPETQLHFSYDWTEGTPGVSFHRNKAFDYITSSVGVSENSFSPDITRTPPPAATGVGGGGDREGLSPSPLL